MRIVLRVLLFCTLLIPFEAGASALGVAGNYNEFIFGNIRQNNTDVMGRVAAGGNVRYRHMSIASQIKPDPYPELVVGGNLRWRHGSVGYFTKEDPGNLQGDNKKGDILVGGIAKIGTDKGGYETVTYRSLNQGAQLPFNFSTEQSYLKDMSTYWGQMSANGTTQIKSGEIVLAGTNPYLNIFSVAASDIKRDIGFKINVPEGATILVNVSGNLANMRHFGFYFNGHEGNKDGYDGNGDKIPDFLFPDNLILYNFFEATALKIANIEVHGSILAPWARTRFVNGHIEGNLIAKSLVGTGEAHDELFGGKLPVKTVPEPATLMLLGSGLAGIAALRRRKKS